MSLKYKAGMGDRDSGIKVIKIWEGTKPGNGYTYVILDLSIIEILKIYKYNPENKVLDEI